MLKGIKNLINQKKAFQEAADLILEDEKLDDAVILDEGPEEPELPEEPAEGEEPEDGEKPDEGEKDHDDMLDDTVGGDGEEQPLPVPGNDDLPTPVSAQTGEPIASDDGDLLSAEIDLATNTMKDILPIPPGNAGEAIAGEDLLSQRVDSGFSDDNGMGTPAQPAPEDGDDLLNSSIDGEEPVKKEDGEEGDDLLSEAITVGNAPEEPAPDAGADAAPAEGDTSGAEPAAPVEGEEPPAEDNPVTAAVKDKVAEADMVNDVENEKDAKEALLKKLGNLTKGLEDAKKQVMDSIR